ncbi:MAG: hypothetical protein J6V75_02320 [Bacteroidaceae bacterium]|nr:hypothetical protein [Bacteroidaceae bacterium]
MKYLGITTVLAAALSIGNVTAKTFDFNPDFKVGFDAGTTGTGIVLESRINDMFGVRTGFDWVPHFEFPMQFTIQVGKDGKQTEESRSKFNRLAGYLEDMTGFKIDQHVDMIGEPNFYNFKLLVDVYPFNNKKWYFTAGFYAGPSVIGRAYNRTEDMTTLMCVAMYNSIYEKVWDIEYNEDSELDGVFLGLELPPSINQKILESGRMGMYVGDYNDRTDQDGNPAYIMEPDGDNMVKAEMKVDPFRPYIGAGYNGLIDKKNDRLRFAIDCGIMFWGGTPKVYTHDGTEIIMGLDNVIGQVGKYTDIARRFKVFPMLNLSVSYTLFK